MTSTQVHEVPGSGELTRVAWRISTRSNNNGGQCVEVGPICDGTGRVAVRHSRHRDGATVVVARGGWDAFLAVAKTGTFDF